jgi:hypothetical protein
MATSRNGRWGKITERWSEDGYVYLKMGNEHRYIAQGSANTALANAGWPKGSRERRILWQRATPWAPKRNPRKLKGRSTTLRNMASITIQKLPNGVVKITGRKMAPKRNGPLSRLLRHPSRVKSEYGYQRAGGSSRRESLKRAVRTSAYNPRKRKGKR